MAEKLKQKQVIATSNLEELAEGIVCTADSKDCAYGECLACRYKRYPTETLEGDTAVVYKQWILKRIPRGGKTSDERSTDMINITAKTEVTSTLQQLVEDFQGHL